MSMVVVEPDPLYAAAILLLPSGHRAYDEDFLVTLPVPRTVDIKGRPLAIFTLLHVTPPGEVDVIPRALYVLGGRYYPHGSALALDPDETHDQ